MQDCFKANSPAVKAVLWALDYTVEEEANWACEVVAGSYSSRQDVKALLLSKLCSDGDVGLALGRLQMYYDDVGDTQGLFKSLLSQLLSVPGEKSCIANALQTCTQRGQTGIPASQC